MMIERSHVHAPRARASCTGYSFAQRNCVRHTGQIAMCATGIVPMLLVFTGLWVWLRKRRGERIARERQSLRERAAMRA